ncbi:MAG TPA: DUF4202 domain-containing protein [Ilumatobacteraceae bacterium]|nr:DUF4202 domain-containing protein [Ilumatobacteraceae bacterium]
MRNLSPRYDAAVAAIDDANAADPTAVDVRGQRVALALVHGRLAVEWIEQLVDNPREALLLAGRAHHLRRWEVPRDSYPVGRAGYLRWRRGQKARHATDVAAILEACGYETSEIEDVQRLIRRESVDGAQAVEDAACLVFIETQLALLANRMDHDLLVEVIRKTARKMSDRGLELVASIPLGEAEHSLLSQALGGSPSPG